MLNQFWRKTGRQKSVGYVGFASFPSVFSVCIFFSWRVDREELEKSVASKGIKWKTKKMWKIQESGYQQGRN